VTPDLVKRIRGVIRPETGKIWDNTCRTGDAPVDPKMTHGIKSRSSLKVCDMHENHTHNHPCISQASLACQTLDPHKGLVTSAHTFGDKSASHVLCVE